MNTLVIYDSEFGNTEQLARVIAEALGSFGPARTASVRQPAPPLAGVDLLIAGCPTWKTRPSQPMRDFVASLPRKALAGIAVASFDTEYRRTPWLFKLAAARSVAGRLKRKGGRLIVPAERFFVVARQGPLEDGELERAASWAREIGEKLHTDKGT